MPEVTAWESEMDLENYSMHTRRRIGFLKNYYDLIVKFLPFLFLPPNPSYIPLHALIQIHGLFSY